MKKINILSLCIILLIFFPLLSINVNAEETPDADKLVVVVDEEYRYYNLSGMVSVTWEDFLSYYNTVNEQSPFAIVGDYVIYEECFLTCRNALVKATDTIVNSTGAAYYLGDPLYTVAEETIAFSTNIPEEMLFSELTNILSVTDPDNLLTLGGYYGIYYAYYNSRQIFLSNDVAVSGEHNIGSGITYKLSEICSHDYAIISYIVKETCISAGSGNFECRRCGASAVLDIPADPENGHDWEDDSYEAATCLSSGYRNRICSYCGQESHIALPALGHDLNFWGVCQRSGCDYSAAKAKAEEVGQVIQGVFNNFGQSIKSWWTDKVEDAKDWAEEAVEDTLENNGLSIDAIWGVFGLIVIYYLIKLAAPIVYYVLKILKLTKDKKGKKRREK